MDAVAAQSLTRRASGAISLRAGQRRLDRVEKYGGHAVPREIASDADAHYPSVEDADPARRRVRVFLIHAVFSVGFGGGSPGAGSATSSAQQ